MKDIHQKKKLINGVTSLKMKEIIQVEKQIKFFDYYLCKIIHNPIISSIIIITSISILNISQIIKIQQSNKIDFIFINDYYFDLLQNIINFIFIVRFILNKFKTNLIIESILFIFQNLGCYLTLFNPNVSLLYSNINYVFKVLIVWQSLCPYIILIVNFMDYLKNKNNEKHEFDLKFFLIESNNNFLPIFIAHSYIFINFNFPFLLSSNFQWLIFIYKLYSFSLKFFCIYQFILFELVRIFYSVNSPAKNYSSYYTPVNLSPKISIWSRIYDYKHWFLFSTCIIVCLFDGFFIALYHLNS